MASIDKIIKKVYINILCSFLTWAHVALCSRANERKIFENLERHDGWAHALNCALKHLFLGQNVSGIFLKNLIDSKIPKILFNYI